jgi:hypothetical protein
MCTTMVCPTNMECQYVGKQNLELKKCIDLLQTSKKNKTKKTSVDQY